MDMKELLGVIAQWGIDRNFPQGATTQGQVCKLAEEWGKEACANILASNREKFKDDVGDQIVVLVMYGLAAGIPAEQVVGMLANQLSEYTGIGTAANFWIAKNKSVDPFHLVFPMMAGVSIELGNLAEASLKNRDPVPHIIHYSAKLQTMCNFLGVNVFESLQVAYNEIKDRKGQMIDGAYVKESDLPPVDLQTKYEG